MSSGGGAIASFGSRWGRQGGEVLQLLEDVGVNGLEDLRIDVGPVQHGALLQLDLQVLSL